MKAEIEVNMKTPYPVCTVERNIHKICAKHRITEMERGIPTEVVKHELLNKLSEHLSDFVEYNFENDRHGNTIYTAILYVATGGYAEMSITDAIKDMERHMGTNFSDYMNEPLPHNGQAYIQRDYKTGKDYICCPFCGKKNFPLTPGAHITGQKFKCKGSNCKMEFEVNV